MVLTDRIYLGVHVALTILVCARHESVTHWTWYAGWNLVAIVTIVLLARKRNDGVVWEFAHDWLPVVFFTTVFEEVSFLSLALRGGWQNAHLITLEAALFPVPAGEWLRQYSTTWFTELLEFGYFSFYPLYPAVGGVLWGWRRRPKFRGAFRRMTDCLSVGYIVCYVTYLLFPTQSPSHNSEVTAMPSSGGPFHALVRLIQGSAGVHGNACPSAHIMLAFAVLIFVFRYFPRAAPWILICVLLMCVGAVYDGYHYAMDVIAGAGIGLTVGAGFVNKGRKPSDGQG